MNVYTRLKMMKLAAVFICIVAVSSADFHYQQQQQRFQPYYSYNLNPYQAYHPQHYPSSYTGYPQGYPYANPAVIGFNTRLQSHPFSGFVRNNYPFQQNQHQLPLFYRHPVEAPLLPNVKLPITSHDEAECDESDTSDVAAKQHTEA